MNDLKVTGKQNFMGLDIPVVLGGFGDGKKCISDKAIAEIHKMATKHVRELINRNTNRFENGKDIIDLKVVVLNDDNLLFSLGYSQMQISKAEHIYILSERGYAKLIKIMDTDLAWEIHEKLVDEYFQLREQSVIPKLSKEEMMRIQLGMIDDHEERIEKLEDNLTINHTQSKELSDLARDKILGLVGGKESRAYTYQYPSKGPNDKPQMLYKKLVRRLWCDYWAYFRITSRDNTPIIRYEEAKDYIRGWEPPTILRLDIERVNSDGFDGHLDWR